MSGDEQDRLLGRTIREIAEQRRLLVCLERKAEDLAAALRAAADQLETPPDPPSAVAVPDAEARHDLMAQMESARDRIDDLEETIRGMGYEPPSVRGARP